MFLWIETFFGKLTSQQSGLIELCAGRMPGLIKWGMWGYAILLQLFRLTQVSVNLGPLKAMGFASSNVHLTEPKHLGMSTKH